eukprot:SAG31_NODE_35903_length_318_cov_1.105023_2_plen_28_part_01
MPALLMMACVDPDRGAIWGGRGARLHRA